MDADRRLLRQIYEPSWWLYAFRGQLDGNGHKITGLNITTLAATEDEISATEGSKAGTTALFGSAVNCYVHDLTIENPVINITYQADTHAYVAALAGFVQGTTTKFENVNIKNADVDLTLTDIWYIAVGGLFGGHWGGNAINCNLINSDINVSLTNSVSTENKAFECKYIGGLVGEGYAWLDNCKADVDVSFTLNDTRTTGFAPTTTVYFGGATGSSTYLNKVSYDGTLTLNYTKANGSIDLNIGGISGYQRYGYIKNCLSKANLAVTANLAEKQNMNVGGILGAFDCTYGLMGKAFFNIENCRVSNCLDMATYTLNGNTQALEIVGSIPLDVVTEATAQGFGVDLSGYRRQDNSINYFGAFNCVKLRSEAAIADVDGNIAVAAESDLYGEAVKTTLGNGWKYTEGELPAPDRVTE